MSHLLRTDTACLVPQRHTGAAPLAGFNASVERSPE